MTASPVCAMPLGEQLQYAKEDLATKRDYLEDYAALFGRNSNEYYTLLATISKFEALVARLEAAIDAKK